MKYRYDGPFDEVEVPQLGVTVKRGHQVEATGKVAESLEGQTDWTKVAPPKPPAKKAASKKAAQSAPRKSAGTKGHASAPDAGDAPGGGDTPPSGPTPSTTDTEE